MKTSNNWTFSTFFWGGKRKRFDIRFRQNSSEGSYTAINHYCYC